MIYNLLEVNFPTYFVNYPTYNSLCGDFFSPNRGSYVSSMTICTKKSKKISIIISRYLIIGNELKPIKIPKHH